MAKFLLFVAVILVVHGIMARPENMNNHTSTMKQRLLSMSEAALNKVDQVQVFDETERRELAVHANDFVNKLEIAVYRLFKIIIHTEEKSSHRILPQVGIKLNDILHEIRQVIIAQPTEIKDILKNEIGKLKTETERLTEVSEYFEENDIQGNAKHNTKYAIDKIFEALNELQKFDETHHQLSDRLHGITHDECKEIVLKLNATVDTVNIFDKATAHYFFREGYELSNFISHIIRHLDKESYYLDLNLRNKVDGLAMKLRGIRVSLDAVLEDHKYSDPKEAVVDLKEQFKVTIEGYSQSIMELLHMSKTGDKYVEDNESFQYMVQLVVFDFKISTKALQWKMVQIAGGHPY